MDVDNMQGSTLQAMAEAVEDADVVLVCFSQKYKNSPNCRAGTLFVYPAVLHYESTQTNDITICSALPERMFVFFLYQLQKSIELSGPVKDIIRYLNTNRLKTYISMLSDISFRFFGWLFIN